MSTYPHAWQHIHISTSTRHPPTDMVMVTLLCQFRVNSGSTSKVRVNSASFQPVTIQALLQPLPKALRALKVLSESLANIFLIRKARPCTKNRQFQQVPPHSIAHCQEFLHGKFGFGSDLVLVRLHRSLVLLLIRCVVRLRVRLLALACCQRRVSIRPRFRGEGIACTRKPQRQVLDGCQAPGLANDHMPLARLLALASRWPPPL